MADEPLMFTIWIRNDVTGEATQIKGQGTSIPAAMKDGWDNATESFGKDSNGGCISEARLAVTLRDGRKVFRKPAAFASRMPYAESEAVPVPTCSGDAAKPFATLVEEGKEKWGPPRKKES